MPEYLGRLYPSGARFNLATGSSREDWLKLFLLGIAQTLGRVRPEASRNFVNLCDREGWIAALARAKEDPFAWLQLLNNYLDRQIERFTFQQWLRLLVGLFIVGRGLDDYIDAIRSIDETQGRFSPDQVFNPRANPAFQGGGPDAAPIAQVLGIGCCFVLRELASAGAVANPLVHPFCFVPSRGVRWLVRVLGGPDLDGVTGPTWLRSAAIYSFLVQELGAGDATFDGAFDIPLQLLAYDSELLQRVLNLERPAELDDEGRDDA